MVGLEILFKIYPEKRVEFLLAFDMMKAAEHLEAKRIDIQLFEQIKEPNTFLWLEHWQNTESLAHYCNDNKFRALMGAIEILGKLTHKRTHSILEEATNA
jgi:quinol monooxygenase YgiN